MAKRHPRPNPDKESDRPAPPRRGSGYWSGAHTTHRLLFHLVWIPKYRRRVLEGAIAVRVAELFRQACEVNHPRAAGTRQLHELNVQPDHVHLLLQISPRVSVAKVVNLLKGGSSRLLRVEFPELEEFLWGNSFWCDGYFAESIGQTEEGVIRRYIQQQGQQPG
jgi:putative transposase